jgi:hypothetical protein
MHRVVHASQERRARHRDRRLVLEVGMRGEGGRGGCVEEKIFFLQSSEIDPSCILAIHLTHTHTYPPRPDPDPRTHRIKGEWILVAECQLRFSRRLVRNHSAA